MERANPAAKRLAGHGNRLPGRPARPQVGDVIVQAHRPEAVFQTAKLEGPAVAGEREWLRLLGVNEGQDRPETGTEHPLPAHQAVEIVGRDPVFPVAPPPGVLAALSLHLHHQVLANRGYSKKSGFFTPSSPKMARRPRRSPRTAPAEPRIYASKAAS